MTIGFALPSTNRGNKSNRIRASSTSEQQGGKLTLQLAWLAGKKLVTVPRRALVGSAKTGEQDRTQTWTSTVESSARGRKSYRHLYQIM